MAQSWYYTKDGKNKVGPLSEMQLKELASTGEVRPTDMVRSENDPKWTPAAQVDGLFGNTQVAAPSTAPIPASPLPAAPAPASPDGSSPPLSGPSSTTSLPWWRRALDETKETGRATWAQTTRIFKYWGALWRGRSLRRDATSARRALGQRMIEAELGDSQVRSQIAVLDEKIRQAEAAKQSTGALQTERDALVLQLASPALDEAAPLESAEPEYGRAKEAHARYEEHTRTTAAARAILFPQDRAGRRRVLTGSAFVGCTFLFLIFVAVQSERAAKKNLEDADRLWQAGQKVEAAAKYKAVIDQGVSSIERSQRPTVFQRVIEVEAEKGNTSAAKALILKAMSYDIALSSSDPATRALLSEVQAEEEKKKVAQSQGSRSKYDWNTGDADEKTSDTRSGSGGENDQANRARIESSLQGMGLNDLVAKYGRPESIWTNPNHANNKLYIWHLGSTTTDMDVVLFVIHAIDGHSPDIEENPKVLTRGQLDRLKRNLTKAAK